MGRTYFSMTTVVLFFCCYKQLNMYTLSTLIIIIYYLIIIIIIMPGRTPNNNWTEGTVEQWTLASKEWHCSQPAYAPWISNNCIYRWCHPECSWMHTAYKVPKSTLGRRTANKNKKDCWNYKTFGPIHNRPTVRVWSRVKATYIWYGI